MSAGMEDDQLEKLLEGQLSWEELRNDVLPDPKDPNRFQNVRRILESKVDWDEPILVPLNDHLYVVGMDDGKRVVKAECGHELCSVDENWKLHCQLRVREDAAEMEELYPKWLTPDPEWTFQLREFFCPECYTLVEVDALPAGYPILKPFDPDVDTFYNDWLDQPVPQEQHE